MRKLALLAAVLVPAALAAAATALSAGDHEKIAGVSGTVWAVERFDGGVNTMAAFNAADGTVLGVVRVGRRPIGVVAPRGTGKVYSADERSDQLTVVDKSEFAAGRAHPRTIQMGGFPHHMVASPDGKRLYVAEYNTHMVGIVDTQIDARVDGFYASGNPQAKTHAVWVTEDGKTLYAANEGATTLSWGTVSKIDIATGQRVWEVPLGIRPSEVLVTPNGKTLYATVRNENLVRIWDVSGTRPELVRDVPIGTQPDTMRLTPDGKTLVVGLRGTPQMALLSTDTYAVRQVTFTGYGISGHQWLSEDGKYTFIALESVDPGRPGGIGVVDNAAASVVAIWPYPGGPWPHGVFYEPQVLR
jgi:DNA-binding beta-propeller fold protein YncE